MAIRRRIEFAVLQLVILWQYAASEDNSNSSAAPPGTQTTLSNSLNGQSTPNIMTAGNTSLPTTPINKFTGRSQSHINRETMTVVSLPIKPTPSLQVASTNYKNGTASIVKSPTTGSEGLPFWVYLLIAAGVILVLCLLAILLYSRINKCRSWKDTSSYMVWNDNELQLSPAFTRESEFLLDNIAAAEQALQNPAELQIYEIPLDSVTHQRTSIYIGGKRVAPRRDTGDSVKQKDTHKSPIKHAKKRDSQVNVSTSNDKTTTSVVISDGGLDSTSSLTRFPKRTARTLSPKSLDEDVKGATLPRDSSAIRSESPAKRSRSGSHLIQDRPLPETPVSNLKRLSKSLDKLRFFNTLPGRTKANVLTRSRPLPVPPLGSHPPLVKSASIGSNVNNIIHSSHILGQPPSLPPRRSSVEAQRKSSLSHRHSKSLDTIFLLKELDWTAIDIYHSYESVHGSSKNVESPYASVGKRSSITDPALACENDRPSSDSPSSLDPGFEIDADCDDLYGCDHPYASVSDEERSKLGSFSVCDFDNKQSLSDNEVLDPSSANSELSTPSCDVTSPYASVRISQIPGCGSTLDRSHDEQHIYSGEVFEGSSDYSSANSLPRLPRPNSDGYIEILPDECTTQEQKGDKESQSNSNDYLEVLPNANEVVNAADRDPMERPNSNRSSGAYVEMLPDLSAEESAAILRTGASGDMDSNTYLDIIPDKSAEVSTNAAAESDADIVSQRHSYLEIKPDRSSIVSETSSGYARPIDVMTSGYVSCNNSFAPENADEGVKPSMEGVYDNIVSMADINCDQLQNGTEENPDISINEKNSLGIYDNLNPTVFNSIDQNSNPTTNGKESNRIYDNLFPTEMDNMGFEDSERSSPARFDKNSDVSDQDSDVVDVDVAVHSAHAHAYLQGAEETESCA